MTINDETFLNPRVNNYFEIYPAPNCISFLQHNSDGSQPIAVFNSLDKSVEFFGDIDIPNRYNKTELDSLLANINLSDYYNQTEMDLIVSNIDLSNYYTKSEIDDINNELSNLILNTYTKTEADTLLFNSSSQPFSAISLINLELGLNYKTATQLAETCYNKAEVDKLITFDPNVVYTKTEINSMLNNNYSSIEDRDQLFLAYSSTNQINGAYYDKAETDYLLANKISNTGDISMNGNLDVGWHYEYNKNEFNK